MSLCHIIMRSNSASFSNHRIIDAILFSLFSQFADLKLFSNVDFEMGFANSFVIYFSFSSFIFRLFSLYILSSRQPYSLFYFFLLFPFFFSCLLFSFYLRLIFICCFSFFLLYVSCFCFIFFALFPPPVLLQLNFLLIFIFVLSIFIFSFYSSACIFPLSLSFFLL